MATTGPAVTGPIRGGAGRPFSIVALTAASYPREVS